MPETTAMATVSIHYWAAAKAAAGVAVERFEAGSVAAALEQARDLRHDAHFDRVLSISSVLVNGLVTQHSELADPLSGPVQVEVLPPFAGGGDAKTDPARSPSH